MSDIHFIAGKATGRILNKTKEDEEYQKYLDILLSKMSLYPIDDLIQDIYATTDSIAEMLILQHTRKNIYHDENIDPKDKTQIIATLKSDIYKIYRDLETALASNLKD